MSKKKPPTFSREEKYYGFSNEDVKSHQKQIYKLTELIKKHQIEIDKIKEDCEHEFKFWCSGAYGDSYYCSKCGEDIEK